MAISDDQGGGGAIRREIALDTRVDERFVSAVIRSADARATSILDGIDHPDTAHLPHRTLASRIKLLAACCVTPESRYRDSILALDVARQLATHLTAQQGKSGLFVGGDNVNSPPDSAFSLNDLADAAALLARAGVPDGSAATLESAAQVATLVAGLELQLKEIADAAKPALLTGGVHTPNHRWEISAALARLARAWPDPDLRARADEWLAEGIDIDSDGFYSERSPNYAAYVSNPALLVIGDVFDLPELHDLVERNLSLTLDLIRPDGSVETIQSRRQDQNHSYPLAPYLLPFRRLAIERNRPDFSWAATQATRDGIADPETVLTDILLHPRIAEVMPEPTPPARERSSFASRAGLASVVSPTRTLVAFGGSDYPVVRTIRSGLANNPTLGRLFAGRVVLDSIRLSRDFFGLGPFRADRIELVDATDTGEAAGYRLTETVGASYFQPMAAERRSPEGEYALTDDGRFSASMAFDDRATDTVSLTTTVLVTPTASGAELHFTFDGPDVAWALELTFRPGGELTGVEPLNDTDGHLQTGVGEYRIGGDVVRFGPGNGASVDSPPTYRPGQDYSFLGGSDATDGHHIYITGRSPGTYVLRLDADRAETRDMYTDPETETETERYPAS